VLQPPFLAFVGSAFKDTNLFKSIEWVGKMGTHVERSYEMKECREGLVEEKEARKLIYIAHHN
jgi:hypothetical protein